MFIWCKVIENGKQCLLQSWAEPTPFSQIFRCPVHGLVNVDGNILGEWKERVKHKGE